MSIHVADTSLSIALARRNFPTRRQGYDPVEVDALLDSIAADAASLVEEAVVAGKQRDELQAALDELRGSRQDDSEGIEQARADLTAAIDQLADERAARRGDQDELEAFANKVDELQAELAAVVAERDQARREAERDAFGDVGEQVASVLRAAYEAADDIRRAAEYDADHMRTTASERAAEVQAETDALVRSILDEAEAASQAAHAEAERVSEEARAEAERVLTEARERVEQLEHAESDLRNGLEAAASWILRAARDPLAELPAAAVVAES